MNKALIVIIVVISAYLIYGSFSNDEKVDLGAVAKVETKSRLKDKPVEVIEDELTNTDDTIKHLDGIYSLYFVTDIAETEQEFIFYPDNTFKLTRRIVVPADDHRDFMTKGSYAIIKNEVVMALEESRNTKFFPKSEMRLKMLKDGNLKFDTLIVERQ